MGLVEVPKLANYGGFIFGCWDAGAPALDDYLGELRWYLDILIDAARRFRSGPGTAALYHQLQLEASRRQFQRRHLPHSGRARQLAASRIAASRQ